MTVRPGVAGLATCALIAALTSPAAPATAGPPVHAALSSLGSAGYCPDANGVTVVVDFNELGGGVVVRCAPGAQATGASALQNAGFSITGTNRWGLGFICRIQGKPGPDSEPCINTPPASAYWSYWHASNGGSWTYSQLGVLNRKPPPGSFEGWSFAKDRSSSSIPPPGVAPRRPEPPPLPPPPPPASSAAPNPQRTTAGPARTTSGAGVGPTGQQPGPGSPSSPGQLPTSSDPATPTPGTTAGAESVVDGRRASGSARSPGLAVTFGGLSWSTLVGVSLVALLLIVAGVISYRRRALESRTNADPPPEPDAGP